MSNERATQSSPARVESFAANEDIREGCKQLRQP
jgi:hypothetical protein